MLQVLNVDMVDRGLCFTATNIDCSLDMELQAADTTGVESDQVTFIFDKHRATFEELGTVWAICVVEGAFSKSVALILDYRSNTDTVALGKNKQSGVIVPDL